MLDKVAVPLFSWILYKRTEMETSSACGPWCGLAGDVIRRGAAREEEREESQIADDSN